MGRSKVKPWPWGWMLAALASCALVVACNVPDSAAQQPAGFTSRHVGNTMHGMVYVLTDGQTGCQYIVTGDFSGTSTSIVPRWQESGSMYYRNEIVGCR